MVEVAEGSIGDDSDTSDEVNDSIVSTESRIKVHCVS